MKTTSFIKCTLFTSVLFLFSSCSILLDMLEPTPPEEVIKNLKLDYTSGHRLFGNIQVDGTIENNGCITIYDTKIKATITHKDGTTSNEEISINVGIGDHSKIEFQEIIAASWSDEISLKITSARY